MSTFSSLAAISQPQIDPLTGKIGTSAANASSKSSSSNSSLALGNTSSLANESTFLTLLVAQLKNQDPAKPADGTEFVTQLAQFTTLEQNLAMRNALDSIDKKTPVLSPDAAVPAKSSKS